VQPTYAQSTTTPRLGAGTRIGKPTLDDMGPGTDRPVPARDADAVSRIRKPSLDEMGSAANRPIPARNSPSPDLRGGGRGEGQPHAPRSPQVDPRTKAGAFGEKVRGPHKPTLDEMGPHAERGLPVAGKPLPVKPPVKIIEVPDETERKKHRHGRPRKTGRPGQ
jgi:excinuclease ABC subunit B